MTDEQVEKIIKSNMLLQMNLAGIRADFEEASQRKPLTDEQKIVLGFLDGSNALQNVWFGDNHPLIKQKYWWRRFLRQAFADEFAAHGIKEEA